MPHFRVLALCLLCSSMVCAQDTSTEVDRLKTRIQRLENENAQLRAALTAIQQSASLALNPPRSTPQTGLIIALGKTDWRTGTPETVEMVCRDAMTPIWNAAGSPPIPPIVIINTEHGPLTQYERAQYDSFVIHLNTEGARWSQITFQAAHEFCHALAVPRDLKHKHKWLEEVYCECASHFALQRMAKTWAASEIAYKQKYAKSLKEYSDSRMAKAKQVQSLSNWYATNRNYLESNPTDYVFQLPASVALFKYMQANPQAWATIPYLNSGPPGDSLRAHFMLWQERVPQQHKQHIVSIASIFEIRLPSRK